MAKRTRLDYLEAHEACEACRTRPSIAVHHIKSRGAGGGDEDENILALCYPDHVKIHKEGPGRFIEWYPLLYTKIVAIKTKLAGTP